MNLPDTENAHYHYAFKKGYRMAMDGKPMSHMPSSIRRDPALREYFQMGWNQLQEELANGEQDDARPPWRSRFAWFFMMLLAGIGTASLMVAQINEKKEAQQAKIDAPEPSPKTTRPGEKPATPSKAPTRGQPQENTLASSDLGLIDSTKQTVPKTEESPATAPEALENKPEKAAPTGDGLSLLSPQARQDLAQTRQEVLYNQSEKHVTLAPVQASDIRVEQAVLAENVSNLTPVQPLDGLVPKYVRKVFFFTRIDQAAGRTIYHRWVYRDKVLATVPLKITSPRFRTWSSKRLSSAWPGQWHIEVLDDENNVIYRYSFNYIK
ncbi:hypothetical protein AVO42_10520 [Thiomicrospira sp. XS5]|uniref:DUF2914 domain-containing protein n=1 Tax=Thiomicrospira sp. XS5 TaxID=1775636 RepID=UPI0007465BFD|nr:DUF2914 domain-containing protein [Thiomicrospira sp. XS5]KUJ75717.1 hypothetical protein AVO42_10520 [Thiomicrospira sp. XS5]